MNYQHNFAFRRSRLVSLISVVTLYGVTGCSDPGDALPGASNVTIKHDASVKRDTALATGGAGGGTTVATGSGGSGGSGGTTDVVLGTGGSTATVPDASIPRDTLPDLASDTARSFLDVGVGPETSAALDTAAEVQKDGPPVSLDVSPPDAPVEGLHDAMLDARDAPADVIAPEAGDLANNDLPSDLPADLTVLPPDTADAPTADTADAAAGPACSNPSWAKQFGFAQVGSLAGDKDGNPYVANTFFNALDLGGTVGTLTSAGDSDSLIVRVDPATGLPVWAKQFGDSAAQTAAGVAVDKSGHVGFVGNFQGSMTIGSSPISNLGTWPYAFVGAVQAADGAGQWAISANLSLDQGSSGILSAIAANPNFDDFVVCGKSNVAATELVASAVAGGGYDLVVAKIKGSDGSILWSRQIGGTGDQSCAVAAIDDSGNVFIAGTFNGQLDFGSGPFSPAPAAGNAIPWIAKLNGGDGSTIAATNATPAATGRTQAVVYGIDTDSAGNVAMVGSFTNGMTFGSTTLTSAGLADAFAIKLGPSLASTWAKKWGDAKTQAATSVAFNSSGDLTVVGPFFGTINIGLAGAILTAASDSTGSNTDIFVARLSGTTGDSQCAVSYGDPAAQDAFNVVIPRSATGANKDVAFASGQFVGNSVLNFGSVTLDTTGLSGANYFWLAKF